MSTESTRKELLEIAASVESRFDHPIARSIINYAKEKGITHFCQIEHAEDIPGKGIKAKVEQ